jgi:hypothetical protein
MDFTSKYYLAFANENGGILHYHWEHGGSSFAPEDYKVALGRKEEALADAVGQDWAAGQLVVIQMIGDAGSAQNVP